MKKANPYRQIGALFRQISHPTRLKILREIGRGEACVCHLEAKLGMRQAYLSQHLMALRDAEILKTERDGRYIYYRLADPAILELVNEAGAILGIEPFDSPNEMNDRRLCSCPKCSGEK
jgi:DNA-binding transcriptional ArsR family regulator